MAVSVSQRLSDALYAPGVYSGRGGWLYRSLRGSQIVSFDLKLRDSKHSKRKSRADFAFAFVGFTHTHLRRSRNASERFCFLVASWKLMTSLSANALMTPVQLCLVRAGFARSLSGRCAGLVVRDFSGLGSCSPAIKIISGEQALF